MEYDIVLHSLKYTEFLKFSKARTNPFQKLLLLGGYMSLEDALVSAMISKIVDKWILPSLSKLFAGKSNELFANLAKKKLTGYLERAYQKHSILNTIVFKNQQKPLHLLYVPLTIVESTSEKMRNQEYKIDTFRSDIIEKYRRILIVDNAGMGKSTLMKFLFLSTLDENQGFPLFIELRKLSCDRSITDEIFEQLNSVDLTYKKEDILRLLSSVKFIYLFDGYDEISKENIKHVTEDIQNFLAKMPNCRVIMSSREEKELPCFGDFQRFQIKPLVREEAFELIRKYDDNSETSKELIQKINTGEISDTISEFLMNPLMVSLLYKTYLDRGKVPYKKNLFYKEVYEALYENHDLTKGSAFIREKACGLDLHDFERILRVIGYVSHRRGTTDFVEETMLDFVRKAKEFCGNMNFKEQTFLRDVTSSVPFFIAEGGEYHWIHKSFQEYFAARYLYCDQKARYEEALLRMASSENNQVYYNILDFCFDIDQRYFRLSIVNNLLCRFIEYFSKTYNNQDPSISTEDIRIRKMLSFATSIAIGRFEYEKNKRTIEFQRLPALIREVFGRKAGDCVLIEYRIASKNVVILKTNSPDHTILRLLRDKKLDIFADMEKLITGVKDLRTQIRSFEELLCEAKCNKQWIVLSEAPDNPLNLEDTFALTNSLLLTGSARHLLLDITKCEAALAKIEKEIDVANGEDFLF